MRSIILSICAAVLAWPVMAEIDVPIVYLRQEVDAPPTLSNLDPIPEDLGIAGARVGLSDNQTTGGFMGHAYNLEVITVPVGGDLTATADGALALSPFIVADAPKDALLKIADLASPSGALVFNVSAPDPSLRDKDCRANLFHTLPSNAMRTDALVQLLLKKRWQELALISGTYPSDVAYAEALRTSLKKFGMKLSAEKTWAFDADMRRNAAQEVPLFTQDLGGYDALIVADETGDFGRYILYNTWEPRPVAGSEGLSAVAWSPVVEQWGAAQMQSRFLDDAGRAMLSKDYAAWAAVRAIGEAVTRTNSNDPATLRAFLLSDAFELAGFKGRPLTFRPWNGQLRQPIPLVHPRALVAQAPLEGFLHQSTELDTLGLDQPESACTAFD